ncbi:MAG: FHA domain-containing protein [Acidimicrobiia bacterium]
MDSEQRPRSWLEVRIGGTARSVGLTGSQVTVGSAAANDIVIEGDQTVSRLHAAIVAYGPSWCVRDLGSSNGTTVNGRPVLGDHRLRNGDEICLGQASIIYRSGDPSAERHGTTAAVQPLPDLSERERAVLAVLCRPLLSGDPFTPPASVREMAARLFVTESAVKQHLQKLYAKFAIGEGGERRVLLANEALRRGAVSRRDLA